MAKRDAAAIRKVRFWLENELKEIMPGYLPISVSKRLILGKIQVYKIDFMDVPLKLIHVDNNLSINRRKAIEMTQFINMRKFSLFALFASLINSAIFEIAKSADATMVVNQGGSRSISLVMVFGATLLGLVVAAYVANLIGKKSQAFMKNAPLIGLLFGIVTAAAPFTASDDSKTAIALASNHVVAGIVWYFGSKRSNQ